MEILNISVQKVFRESNHVRNEHCMILCMKCLICVCLSMALMSCSSGKQEFDYNIYLDQTHAECETKCPNYQAANVFAESNCVRQCMLIKDTFR